MMTSPSKRERTRLRLLDVALDLFETQGYDSTTTVQIAAAAGVSEMTLFRHFASKDRLLLDDPYDPLIAEAVAAQPTRLPPLARVASGVRQAWRTVPEPAEAGVRRAMRIAARTPSLTGAIRSQTRETEIAIARALSDTDPVVAQIAAAAALAALTEALTVWAGADDAGPLDDAIQLALGVLDGAVTR